MPCGRNKCKKQAGSKCFRPVSVSKKPFRHAEAFFRTSKSSEKWGSLSCRTPFPGFPHTPFRPVDVPRRPQAAESKPQPPLMGGRRAAARRGAPPAGGKTPNPRRPGGIVPPRPGVGKGAGPGGLWPPERRPGPAQREPRAGPRQGAAPTPPPGRWGGPRRGRSD